MEKRRPTVFVVDDDPGLCRTLVDLAMSIDLEGASFSSAQEFLDGFDADRPGCLVLDVRMPGMSGLELQRKLEDKGIEIPTIVISGFADVPMAVQAMSAGALTFLEKPFRMQELCEHIVKAVSLDSERRKTRHEQMKIDLRTRRLTAKEREVMDLVAAGNTNKEMAEILGLSIRAVEDRRSRVMKKLRVSSRSELVKVAKRLADEV